LPLFGPPNVDRLIAKKDVSGLIDALEYPVPWRVRRDAAMALGAMGGADAVEALIAALGDDHASVRLAATEALGRIGDRGAVEHLIGVLGSGSRAVEIRKAAADSLGQIGDSRAVDSLLVCLKDASWSVRRAAAEALGWIGDPRAVEPGRVPTLGVTAAVRP
jgi:HEAT repeat protein